MNYSRRDLGLLLPALAAAARAEDAKGSKILADSRVYRYADLPVTSEGEKHSRPVLDGETHTGYRVAVHLTDLPPGMASHAPHKHAHEEVVMLQSGQLDVTLGSAVTRVEAGSVVWAASNQLHCVGNPGPGRAQYFVIELRDKNE